LPLEAAVTIPSPDDGRPVFVIPHPEGVMAGTTDHFHEGDLDDPRPSREEVTYILQAVRAAFPGREVGEGDIRGAFAGLRPIVAAPGMDDPSTASREEALWREDGLLSMAGGKLTTWRAMAEEVVDHALRLLPPERARLAAPCATAGTPVGSPAPEDLPERLGAAFPVTPEIAAALSRRLGGLAWNACEGAEPAELRPLLDGADLSAAEVRAHLRHGAVLRLEDLLLRRARFGMWNPAVARELMPRLEAVFRDELGWDGKRWEVEAERAGRAMEGWKPPDRSV
jgi:glycerol-3-phosphate dehydrogenase